MIYQKVRNVYAKSTGHTAKFCYAGFNCQMNIRKADNSEDFF